MVNIKIINNWLKGVRGLVYPPGTEAQSAYNPINLFLQLQPIGIVREHRFAYYFWTKFFRDPRNIKIYSKANLVFVSIDAHYDVGDRTLLSQYIPDLMRLNLDNDTELGLFCWLRLHPNNDAQILPALYMDFFSDAYILLQPNESNKHLTEDLDSIDDLKGKKHSIKYFWDIDSLIKGLSELTNVPIFFDIDLDYFAVEGKGEMEGVGSLLPDNQIHDTLDLKGSLMSSIYNRIVGFTIALEPRYCGGLYNSAHVLEILDEEFFNKSLFTNKCTWK